MFITSTEIATCYISKTETIVEDQEELLEQENASSIQNTTLNNDKAIPNILEGLLTKKLNHNNLLIYNFVNHLAEVVIAS